MLNIFIILLLLFTFPIRQCADDSVIVPPKIKSNIGYITVKKKVELPPVSKRLFILPQIDLLILQEDENTYMLIYPAKKFSTVCIVPKYAKYTTIMIKDTAKKMVSFRAGLEVETVGMVLFKGEELPVKAKVKGGYIVIIERNNQNLSFFVPEQRKGLEFSKKSMFAKFSKTQKAKGLKYYNGVWMPAPQAVALMTEVRRQNELNAFILKNLFKGGKSGVVVLKDKTVLHGKMKGRDSTHILFSSKGEDYWLGVSDVAPLDFKSIITCGKVAKAQVFLNKAKNLMSTDMGMAKKKLQDSLTLVNDDISDKDLELKKTSDLIIKECLLMFNQIDLLLKKHNQVIYDYVVFPKYVLDYQLNAENILLKRKYWIKPEQSCELCKTKGDIICTLCLGKGLSVKNCSVCGGTGKVKCSICDGIGWRECNICGGKGYIYVKGRSTRFVVGTSYYFPRYWRPGGIVTSGKNIAVIGPSPVFGGPFFGGGTFIDTGNPNQAVKKVCWKCGGTGTLRCPKTRKCKKCKGRGMIFELCVRCRGKKKIECPKCSGKGFTGKVQQIPKTIKTHWVVP